MPSSARAQSEKNNDLTGFNALSFLLRLTIAHTFTRSSFGS